MKSKEVAIAIKNDENIVVHRLKDNVYWAGSIYALVKMDPKEFDSFKKKYNSYKGTPDIPDQIEVDQSVGYIDGEWKEHGPDIKLVIAGPNRIEDLNQVYRTSFKFGAGGKNVSLYNVNDTLGGYNAKYDRIIEQFSYSQTVDNLSPIRCYDGSDLKAVIMPVRLAALPMASEYELLVRAKLPRR